MLIGGREEGEGVGDDDDKVDDDDDDDDGCVVARVADALR
jgi:hypothetical protein